MLESCSGAIPDSQGHSAEPAAASPAPTLYLQPCSSLGFPIQGLLERTEGWKQGSLKLRYGSFSTTCEALPLSLVSTLPLTPRCKDRERKNHFWIRPIKKEVGTHM